MATQADQTRAIGSAALAALAGAALLGLAPIGVRLSELGPQATNLWRFVFALPILAVLARFGASPKQRDLAWLLLAGVLFGFDLSLWAAALGKTTVTNATLLANMTPVFAAAFGWIALRERLSAGVALGVLTALAGAVTLSFARARTGVGPASVEQGWIGDAMSLAAAFCYASYLVIVRGLGVRVSVGAVMFWATLSAACCALALSFAFGESLFPHSVRGWLILIVLGVVVQAGGQGLIAYGVARLPIVGSTVLLWMQPLVAAALSWLMFGEALGPLAFVAAALILAGIYVVQRARASS